MACGMWGDWSFFRGLFFSMGTILVAETLLGIDTIHPNYLPPINDDRAGGNKTKLAKLGFLFSGRASSHCFWDIHCHSKTSVSMPGVLAISFKIFL